MNPWDYATDVYFENGQRVKVQDTAIGIGSVALGAADGVEGRIVGLSFDHVIKIYIVLLDKPIDTPWLPMKQQSAIAVPCGYLRPV